MTLWQLLPRAGFRPLSPLEARRAGLTMRPGWRVFTIEWLGRRAALFAIIREG